VAEPHWLLQVNSYSVLFDSLPVDQVPLVASGPCQPPLAVHVSALVASQLKVELPRVSIVVGEAVSFITGVGCVTTTCLDCVAAPPEPVHVSV
jgi:hypothetical protein